MECKIDQCTADEYVRGLCKRHYQRWWKTGTTDDGPKPRAPLHQRLWAKIDKRGPDECWPWTGCVTAQGYGRIGRGGGRGGMMLPHRAVWEEANGAIPQDGPSYEHVIMHTCDNRLCCNPSHLRLGSQADNTRDMDEKGRRVSAYGERHCCARLTEDDVRSIRASAESTRKLGARYGVSSRTISDIKRRETWRHVT